MLPNRLGTLKKLSVVFWLLGGVGLGFLLWGVLTIWSAYAGPILLARTPHM